MTEHEFDDLTITVSLSYQDAERALDLVESFDDLEDKSIIDAIRYAMREAVKERRDQERRDAPA